MNHKLVRLGEQIHDALKAANKNGVAQYHSNLGGACAVGSYLLIQEAKSLLNLDLKFVATEGHAWTEFENRIYDVTATQFSRDEKVFHWSRDELNSISGDEECLWYYKKKSRIDLKHINDSWPDYQKPQNYGLIWLFDAKPIITYSIKSNKAKRK